MKKQSIILLLMFCCCFVWAQERNSVPEQTKGKSQFRGGLRLGFTGSVTSDDGFPYQGFNKFGAFAGAFVNFPVSKNGKWRIQPELNFIMKGCKHVPKRTVDGDLIGDQYVLQLMYGELPVLVIYKIWKGLEIEAGPVFGVLIDSKEEVNGYENVGAPKFIRYAFSGILGVSYTFWKGMGAGLRYQIDFLPVRKYSAHHWTYVTGGQHTQLFGFSMFYQF